MGKKGNRLSESALRARRLKRILVLVLALIFAVLTTGTGFLAIFISKHTIAISSKMFAYSAMIMGYILLAGGLTNLSFVLHEKAMNKFIDTDYLTNGINYEKFLKDAQELIENNDGMKLATFYGDILNFKYINDTFGYDTGDQLLMLVSQSIRDIVVKHGGLSSRISGDKYVVIAPYRDKNEFIEYIYSVIDDISFFEPIEKANYKPDVYVGIYCSDLDAEELTISEMLDRANMAQKSIKGSTEYHIAFYTEEIRDRVIAEKDLERRMESALENGEFKAYFQPKYEVSTGEIVGAEALVRWDSPESGFMSPGKFIPLFEQNGFIINLDQYVFETVCKNMREWLDNGVKVVPVSINVSRLQFYRIDFVKRYAKIKEKYDIPDGLLELEFTESMVFENLDILRKIVQSLKKVGFSCSVDDFGSGYSSLNILKNLPMDTLKLDKVFFDDSENLSRDKALISSVINMSRALNMKTVAEGIESWAQVAFLKEIGCDIIQGYVFSEPIPHDRFTNILTGNRFKEMPTEFIAKSNLIQEVTDENAAALYKGALGMLDGLLLEVDFLTGDYKFVDVNSTSKTAAMAKSVAPMLGDKYDMLLGGLANKVIHPEDVDTLIKRCSAVNVMTSFYQREVRIVTEFRIMMQTSKRYEWAKITIIRINPDSEDFNAFVYVEPRRPLPTEVKDEDLARAEFVYNALYAMTSIVYEFDLKARTFEQIYCDDALIGEQPKSGETSWLYECYLPKVIAKEKLSEVLEFANPANVEKALAADDVNELSFETEVKFKGKEPMNAIIKVAKVTSKKIDGVRIVLLAYIREK